MARRKEEWGATLPSGRQEVCRPDKFSAQHLEIGTRKHEHATSRSRRLAGRTEDVVDYRKSGLSLKSCRGLPFRLRLLRSAPLPELRYEATAPGYQRPGCCRPAGWALGFPKWRNSYPGLQSRDGSVPPGREGAPVFDSYASWIGATLLTRC